MPVLSSTRTSAPDPRPLASSSFARCQDVERPWTPAPITTTFALVGNDTALLLPLADGADAEQGPVGGRHRRPLRAAPIGLVDPPGDAGAEPLQARHLGLGVVDADVQVHGRLAGRDDIHPLDEQDRPRVAFRRSERRVRATLVQALVAERLFPER